MSGTTQTDFSPVYAADPATREEVRAHYLEMHTLKGVQQGLRYGLSMRCTDGDHHRWSSKYREHTGCRNDGSTCLCRCHDKQRTTLP